MNVELLQRIKAHILEDPRRVGMSNWIRRRSPREGGPSCGTVACIAGWAYILSERQVPPFYTQVTRLLGLDSQQGQRLFFELYWPSKFYAQIQTCQQGAAEYAQTVADRIDHFIATEGRE
jgi:hypothetical protein